MLYYLPKDLQQFKTFTKGGVVVMGYNTYLSLPNHFLPNRTNIVISHRNIDDKNIINVKNMQELFEQLKNYNTNNVWVIGGAKIYEQLKDFCSEAIITKVNDNMFGDTIIDNFDDMLTWEKQQTYSLDDEKYKMECCVYRNKNVKNFNKF